MAVHENSLKNLKPAGQAHKLTAEDRKKQVKSIKKITKDEKN